ncbi:hypothetical protein SADUNF_Sadunf18G0001500 [Salix dunnii]|uniref:Uncharacterized protein n=1 Tax=Salix dunnii TaxID=1413687 RepID=A0A835MD15_9ROSI|nr:hypothetical protein SADUNF_Sadunf18G0001500 [Salix dunnii]
MPSSEDMEQMMVEKLSENAEMIQAVVNGNLPEMADLEAADSNNIEGFKTDFIRSQGNKLIACLENIVSTLRQFPWLLQDATTRDGLREISTPLGIEPRISGSVDQRLIHWAMESNCCKSVRMVNRKT